MLRQRYLHTTGARRQLVEDMRDVVARFLAWMGVRRIPFPEMLRGEHMTGYLQEPSNGGRPVQCSVGFIEYLAPSKAQLAIAVVRARRLVQQNPELLTRVVNGVTVKGRVTQPGTSLLIAGVSTRASMDTSARRGIGAGTCSISGRAQHAGRCYCCHSPCAVSRALMVVCGSTTCVHAQQVPHCYWINHEADSITCSPGAHTMCMHCL